MKHLTVESKDLLIGDEAADVLTEYAAIVARLGSGDNVELHCISSDGDEVIASLVLSSGTSILTETTHNSLPEPDNSEVIAYMRERIRAATTPPAVQPAEGEDVSSWERQFDDL
jgi:hypothetical protein